MRKVKHYFGSHRTRRGKRSSLPRWMKLWVTFTVTDLSAVLQSPIERDPNPPVVPRVRYCDYELERTPEMQAVYDEAVAKAIKD